MTEATLSISFLDEECEIAPGTEFAFGRDADLIIDTSKFLHRRLGVFRYLSGTWWLSNVGSAIGIDVVDMNSPSRLSIAPGAGTPLPFTDCKLVFKAGPTNYEITVSSPSAVPPPLLTDDGTGTTTVTALSARLNDEQRLLLVALAESRLRGEAHMDLPTNREVARSLGWTAAKFNRKLDNLCTKFDRLGVSGIKGDLGGLANTRRDRLVDYVVTAGIIDVADLPLLEDG